MNLRMFALLVYTRAGEELGTMKRREAVKGIIGSSTAGFLGACSRGKPSGHASDEALAAVLREFGSVELAPGEAAQVRAAIKASAFSIRVDPEVQPQLAFDPVVEI